MTRLTTCLAAAFRHGTITTTFARESTSLAGTTRLQLATLRQSEVFTRRDAVLCGIDEAKNLLAHVFAEADQNEVSIEALSDGDTIARSGEGLAVFSAVEGSSTSPTVSHGADSRYAPR